MALTEKLSAIGDAIREKTGKEDKLSLDQMPVEIASIVSGGGGSGGGDSGSLFLGDCEFFYGQFTPTETGSLEIPIPVESSRNIRYGAVWLDDASVIAEKYSAANIMLESHIGRGGGHRVIHYATNGNMDCVVTKSQFGLRSSYGGAKQLVYEAHANWPAQPETYNWIALVEV